MKIVLDNLSDFTRVYCLQIIGTKKYNARNKILVVFKYKNFPGMFDDGTSIFQ